MDWLQVLYAFIGGFFGFGFALVAEAVISFINGKSERRKRLDSLKDELFSISDDLEGHEDSKTPIYFEVPVWQAVISTGTLLTFLKEDKELYDRIMVIYNRIFALRAMEADFDRNYNNIVAVRREVISEIAELEAFEEERENAQKGR